MQINVLEGIRVEVYEMWECEKMIAQHERRKVCERAQPHILAGQRCPGENVRRTAKEKFYNKI